MAEIFGWCIIVLMVGTPVAFSLYASKLNETEKYFENEILRLEKHMRIIILKIESLENKIKPDYTQENGGD